MSFISGSGVNGFSGLSVTVPAGSLRIGLFSCTFECTTTPTSLTATLGGQSLTAVNNATSSTGLESTYMFCANEALLTTIGTGTQTLTFTFTGGTGLQGLQSEWSFFANRAQGAPASGVNSDVGVPPSPNATVTAIGNDADIVGSICLNNAGVTTPGSGYTTVYNAVDGGGDAQGAMEYQAGMASGSQSPGFSSTASPQWAMVAVVLETGSSPTAKIAWIV